MNPTEKIELVLYSISEYADFLDFCGNKSNCTNCVYKVTDLCSVIEPKDFLLLLGKYIKSIGYKEILDKQKAGE